MTVEAEEMALQSGNPRAIVTARGLRAVAERWLGRPGKTVEFTDGMTDVLSKMFNLNQLSGLIFTRGLSLAEIGRIEDAFAALRQGIDLCEKFGSPVHLGRLYNTLGYCFNEIHHPEEAWKWNLKSEGIARKRMEEYPGAIPGEIIAQANVNLMENLFDQGKTEEAWKRIKSFEEESKGSNYNISRDRWGARLDSLASLILLQREKIDEAESRIIKNLQMSRKEHTKKIEGRFLRLLGEVQMKRNEFDDAISSISEAILILKEVGNPRLLWEAHASLASVYEKLGRESEAREQRGAAAEVIKGVTNGLSDRQLREGFLIAKPIRYILARAES
jgi:tetratricopeptide (TPR) repeat protein